MSKRKHENSQLPDTPQTKKSERNTTEHTMLRTSLWLADAGLETTRFQTSFPKVESNIHFDVVVVGAGIVGVSAAYNLKQEGKKVALIEARNVGGGTTGFSTAKLSSLHGVMAASMKKMHGIETVKLYHEMNEEGIDRIEELNSSLGLESDFGRRTHSLYTCGGEQKSSIEAEHATYLEANIPCELVQAAELREELPESLDPTLAVRFPNQAQFNSYKYCVELCKRIDGEGSAVFENTLVANVTESLPHQVTFTDNPSLISGDQVVLATHMPIMDRSMHFSMLQPSRSHCIAVKIGPENKTKNMYLCADDPLRSLRSGRNDEVVVIAGEMTIVGETTDTDKLYETLHDWARKNYDVKEVVAQWSAMDYFSKDHIPFAGYLYRGTDTIFTATGFSKWGIASGVSCANVITDLILGKENRFHSMVDARRWSPTKQASGMLAEGCHTAKHMVVDKVKHALCSKNIKSLLPGEGDVVKAGSHTVGAYVDVNGAYHIVKPVCTHLGCDLVFNKGDRVWDCPCHGSQFDVDGGVLHGPACKPLEVLKNLQW